MSEGVDDTLTVVARGPDGRCFRLYPHQVSGHMPLLRGDGGVVRCAARAWPACALLKSLSRAARLPCMPSPPYRPAPAQLAKPAVPAEVEFYSNLPKRCPMLIPFAPTYHGCVSIDVAELLSSSLALESPSWSPSRDKEIPTADGTCALPASAATEQSGSAVLVAVPTPRTAASSAVPASIVAVTAASDAETVQAALVNPAPSAEAAAPPAGDEQGGSSGAQADARPQRVMGLQGDPETTLFMSVAERAARNYRYRLAQSAHELEPPGKPSAYVRHLWRFLRSSRRKKLKVDEVGRCHIPPAPRARSVCRPSDCMRTAALTAPHSI